MSKKEYLTTYKELLLCHGKKITCRINRSYTIDDAKISVDAFGNIGICHNKDIGVDNGRDMEKFGYKYTYVFCGRSYYKYNPCLSSVAKILLIDDKMKEGLKRLMNARISFIVCKIMTTSLFTTLDGERIQEELVCMKEHSTYKEAKRWIFETGKKRFPKGEFVIRKIYS